MKIRFEKTAFGWKAYARRGSAFIFFGHYRTQRDAREALAQGV